MKAEIITSQLVTEYATEERCYIKEISNRTDDESVSVAQARVEPGITTAWHKLTGVTERYIIISGEGRVEVGGIQPADVSAGDMVKIPAGTGQRITNTGQTDLVFYAVCSPRFTQPCYVSLE